MLSDFLHYRLYIKRESATYSKPGEGNMEHIDIEEMMRSIYEVFVRFDKDGSETLELKELMSFMKVIPISEYQPRPYSSVAEIFS